MLSINPTPTDTAVPFSSHTPSWCQQAPVLYAAILHHQPMKTSNCNMFLFFCFFSLIFFNKATIHQLEANRDENKVGEQRVEACGPCGLPVHWEPSHRAMKQTHMFLMLLLIHISSICRKHISPPDVPGMEILVNSSLYLDGNSPLINLTVTSYSAFFSASQWWLTTSNLDLYQYNKCVYIFVHSGK